jgi:uncharacterized DUF497 family protein
LHIFRAIVILQADGFDWDRGNRAKCGKHGLSIAAIESLFTHPLAILPDAAHSQRERRFRAIGRTDKGRGVFIIFTLRREGDELLIRPISARYMHKKEIEAYEKENPGL